MSATTAIAPPRETTATLETYRDDGPISRALGSALGGAVALPPAALLVAAAIPLAAAVALGRDDASNVTVGVVIAWVVLCAGVSSARPHADSLRWLVPPLLRLIESASLIWIAAAAGPSSAPAAFALLAAVAFRQYDLVYRLRYRGVTAPRWVGDVGGGWDGRLLGGFVLLAAGALPAGFFVAAAVLAAVFVSESVAGWAQLRRAPGPALYEDEEDEGH
jgi:hypothetical protein